MLAKLGSVGEAAISCNGTCTTGNKCACSPVHGQVTNLINPSECRGAPLDKVLRHEMQHLLCNTSHPRQDPRPCENDETFACDQQCGLNPAAEGRCAGTVDPSACAPTLECDE